jgi:streptogramin lyase
MQRALAVLASLALVAGCDVSESEVGAPTEREATTATEGRGCAPTRVPETTGTFRVGGFANLIAFGEGAAWTLTENPGALGGEGPSRLTLRRIDPRRGAVEAFLRLRGRGDTRLAAGAGAVWLADPSDGTLRRVDLASREHVVTRPFGRSGEPTAIALERERAWVIANDRGQVRAVGARSGRVLERLDVSPGGLADVEAAFGSVWVATGEAGTVVRVDPRSRRVVARIRVGFANDLAADDSAVWVDLGDNDAVRRIDPVTNEPGRPHRHGGAFAIAAGFGSVWATNYPRPIVTRLDAMTGEVMGRVRVGPDPKGLAVGAGSVWVVNAGDCSVTRIVP